MPFVIIRYGPYLAHGIIGHRKQKINGLFRSLLELGYEIEVIAINQYNRLSIEMFDREVFRCDIRNLLFNMPAEDDPVCQRAVKAVEEAKSRMCAEKSVEGFTSDINAAERVPETTLSPQIMDSSSKTELLFETRRERSARHIRGSETSDTKMEEKIGKVTIMENKTVFLSPFDSTAGDSFKAEENKSL